MRILEGTLIGAVCGPLIVACCGAAVCAYAGGIPMFRIPDPWEAARGGFVLTFLILGAPAAVVGALVGAAIGSASGPKRKDNREEEF